jgi:hypothetical protein
MEDRHDELAYELLKARFDLDWARIGTLDQKAGNAIGFVGIILSLVLAIGDLFLADITNGSKIYYYAAFAIIIFLLIASIFLALLATQIKNYKAFPGEIEDWIDEVEGEDKQFVIESAVLNYKEAIKNNVGLINKKAEYLKYSYYLFFAGLFANSVFIIYIILGL